MKQNTDTLHIMTGGIILNKSKILLNLVNNSSPK